MHVPSFLLDFRFRTAHFALQRLTGLVRHRAGRLARALAAVLAFAAAGVFAFTDVGRCNGLHMFHGCLPSQRGANPPIVFFLYLYNKTRARARGRVPGGQIQWPRSLMGRRPTPRQRECLPLESPHKGMNLLLCLAAFSHRARFSFGSARKHNSIQTVLFRHPCGDEKPPPANTCYANRLNIEYPAVCVHSGSTNAAQSAHINRYTTRRTRTEPRAPSSPRAGGAMKCV